MRLNSAELGVGPVTSVRECRSFYLAEGLIYDMSKELMGCGRRENTLEKSHAVSPRDIDWMCRLYGCPPSAHP